MCVCRCPLYISPSSVSLSLSLGFQILFVSGERETVDTCCSLVYATSDSDPRPTPTPRRPSPIAAAPSDWPDLHHSVPGAEARRFLAREICRNLCSFHRGSIRRKAWLG